MAAMPGSVTSNTRYVVHTHFTVNQNIAGLANIENRLQRLNRVVNAVGRSFAVISAGVGLRRLAGAFFSIHTEIEDAKIGLAGLMTAITNMPAPVALERAAAAMEVMRKAARDGPGELPEYMQSLQTIYSKVIRGGGTQEDAEKLARLAVVANYSLNAQGKKSTLPIDVGQALSQGIGAYTTRHLNELLGAIDPKYADPKKFNKMPYRERLEVVTKALERMQSATDLFSQTWSAQSSTMRDNLRELGRQASSGLFEDVKSDLIRVNQLMAANTDEINQWAHGIDRALVRTYELGKQKVMDPSFRQGVGQTAGTGIGGLIGRNLGFAWTAMKGVPGVGQVINVLTLIGAAIGNVMAKYPKDTAAFVASLQRMGAAVGDFFFQFTKLLVDNPASVWVARTILVTLTDFINALAGLLELLNRLLTGINSLIDRVPDVPDGVGNITKMFPTFTDWLLNPRWTAQPLPISGPGFVTLFPDFRDPVQPPAAETLDELLKRMEYPPQSYNDDYLTGPGDTNLNGPITIIIKAERVDNPDLVARSFREAAERFQEFRRGGRSHLVPKPG